MAGEWRGDCDGKAGRSSSRKVKNWLAKFGRVAHARPVYTSGGKLACKYVIHAVGPIWGEGDEDSEVSGSNPRIIGFSRKIAAKKRQLPGDINRNLWVSKSKGCKNYPVLTQQAWIVAHPDTQIELVRNVLI